MKRFKALTMGKPLVMGRKTYLSIPRALPGRETIVVTRDPAFAPAGVNIAHELDAALDLAAQRAGAMGAEEIIVAGGAEIYAQTMARASRLYITEVALDAAGDARFPPIDPEPVAGGQAAEGRARPARRSGLCVRGLRAAAVIAVVDPRNCYIIEKGRGPSAIPISSTVPSPTAQRAAASRPRLVPALEAAFASGGVLWFRRRSITRRTSGSLSMSCAPTRRRRPRKTFRIS